MRFRGNNVIDVDFKQELIEEAVRKAMSEEFRQFLEGHVDHPYGDGHSSEKILDLLLNTKVDEKLLVKQLTY